MCHFCHKLGYNIGAPAHQSCNCRDTRNNYSKYYGKNISIHPNGKQIMITPSKYSNSYCHVCKVEIDMSTFCRDCDDKNILTNHCYKHHFAHK